MRVAFSGASNTGKTTLIQACSQIWPMYKLHGESHRDYLKKYASTHSNETTSATQDASLTYFEKTGKQYKAGDNVFLDRCALDTFAYTMWAFDHGKEGIDDEFVHNQIKRVRESIKDLDIIFYIDKLPALPVEDGFRVSDILYINEIGNIFEAIYQQYLNNDKYPLFDPDDRPAIIKIESTSIESRLAEVGLYIDLKTGNLIEPNENWAQELTGENADALIAQLATEQERAHLQEKWLK